MANEVVLGLGSNVSGFYVESALMWLAGRLSEMHASSLYPTPPAGSGVRPYVNAVVSATTGLDAGQLNAALKEYEVSCGRDDASRAAGIVQIDIDIVLFNGEVIREWDFNQTFFRIGYDQLCQNLLARR